MRCTLVLLAALLALAGYAPRWHSGHERFRIRHTLERAVVYDGSLSIQGKLAPLRAFTDYGVKTHRVMDDTGKELDFRSFQLFWMKEMRFELEVEAPSPEARRVTADLEFLTRSGTQRIRADLGIERDAETDYRTQLRRWRRERRPG